MGFANSDGGQTGELVADTWYPWPRGLEKATGIRDRLRRALVGEGGLRPVTIRGARFVRGRDVQAALERLAEAEANAGGS